MNYITEINRFYDWLETNTIPKSAIALWQALMHVNNKAGWIREFTVAMSVLEFKTGFKSSELYSARNILMEKKRIVWSQRGGNLSASYMIIPFCLHNMEISTETKEDSNQETYQEAIPRQMGSINKLNKTIINSSSVQENLLEKGELPKDGVKRNWDGFRERVNKLKLSVNVANKIVLCSNYGEIGNPIWSILDEIRDREKTKIAINNPEAYLLTCLNRQ